MKSKFVFGSSDAAVYLAEYLVKKDNRYETRKISAKLSAFNQQVKEIANSNLSPDLKFMVLNQVQHNFASVEQHSFTNDTLLHNLIANISRGKVREIFRELKKKDPKGFGKHIRHIGDYEAKGYNP
jgi:hypothetical protein